MLRLVRCVISCWYALRVPQPEGVTRLSLMLISESCSVAVVLWQGAFIQEGFTERSSGSQLKCSSVGVQQSSCLPRLVLVVEGVEGLCTTLCTADLLVG